MRSIQRMLEEKDRRRDIPAQLRGRPTEASRLATRIYEGKDAKNCTKNPALLNLPRGSRELEARRALEPAARARARATSFRRIFQLTNLDPD